jgi:hypothetical protein
MGQLSLVEHALCPLDARISLRPNLVHETEYRFLNRSRHWETAHVRVFCPLGLSAQDELYLWGLLALTLRQPEPLAEFHATPHFCLRQFGLIDADSRRGGRQYQQFQAAIERLSVVRYLNDRFYDPIRAEHRKVSFGFFSYSLPIDPESSRAWRFYWDPLFLEFMRAAGGAMHFDLQLYRQFDPASRRLFLLASKVFPRRTSLSLELRHLAVNVLGFSASLIPRDQLAKTRRCLRRLAAKQVLARTDVQTISKAGRGNYKVTLVRGADFGRPSANTAMPTESPLTATLQELGLDDPTIRRVLGNHRRPLLQEWTDITLAARERFGSSFFKRSPAAYFLDNVKQAAAGRRTPPDWWHDVRKAEERRRLDQFRAKLSGHDLPQPKTSTAPAEDRASRQPAPIRAILEGLPFKAS